ncbi:MAG: hypothetical protein Q7R62_02630, partial [bacterium]|nr:hypothetical protein [bacterium]
TTAGLSLADLNSCISVLSQLLSRLTEIISTQSYSSPEAQQLIQVFSTTDGTTGGGTSGTIAGNPGIGVYFWSGSVSGYSGNAIMSKGLELAKDLGAKTVRIYMGPKADADYWGGTCILNSSLAQLADRSDFKAILRDPQFTTVLITAYDWASFPDCIYKNYLNPDFYTPENTAKLEKEYADFANYLKQFSGKKFIILNWEGEGESGGFNNELKNWFNARHRGIHSSGASNVFSGAEFKYFQLYGDSNFLHDVIPYISADYYSYSSYESINVSPERFSADIDSIRTFLSSVGKNGNNLVAGEIGFHGSTDSTVADRLKRTLEVAINKNLPYGIVWALLDSPAGWGMYNLSGNITASGRALKDLIQGTSSGGGTGGGGGTALTATLTVNGFDSLSLVAGDHVQYQWYSTGAVTGSSSLQISPSSPDFCGNRNGDFSQFISGTSGSLSANVAACQAGYGYNITYTTRNSLGQSASDSVTIAVSGTSGGGGTGTAAPSYSSDKTSYIVDDTPRYTISNLPAGQSVHVTFYSSGPNSRGCTSGCAQLATAGSNGVATVYGDRLVADDIGDWSSYVIYNGLRSGTINYNVSSGQTGPTITGLSPGEIFSSGTVNIRGSGFEGTNGTITVCWNGPLSNQCYSGYPFTSTNVSFHVGQNMIDRSGNYTLQVQNSDGEKSNGMVLIVGGQTF